MILSRSFLIASAAILIAASAASRQIAPAITSDLAPGARIPAGTYTLVREWSAADGPGVNHTTGHIVPDAEALGGHALEATVGRDVPARTLLYGPYIELPPGDYVAFYRMKLLDDAGEETVATLDACTNYGQNILRSQDLTGTQLALNRYVEVPLAFQYPGGKLEIRAAWSGYAGLRLDRVTLYSVKGAVISNQAERVAQPVPSGVPNNLVYRPRPQTSEDLFPRSAPPASELYVIDFRKLAPDWQLCVATLQGIVNRKKPRIYCIANDPDTHWLQWMLKNRWIVKTHAVERPEDLLTRYRSEIRGAIITDPALPMSKNMATMLASLENAVVVSPRMAHQVPLPIVEDLRGRWHTNVEAMRWAFDTLWPRLSHSVVACLWPNEPMLRDYLVENRIFIFWLSGPIDGARPYANAQAELNLMEELLAKMPPNIPVMGYPWAGKDVGIGEGPGVTLFAEFAKFLVGSVNCSNLSVHSGIRIAALRQKPAPPAPKLDPRKVYVSWVISDGDNLPVLTAGNFPQLWRDKTRGSFALGWTASPSASMLIPDIVAYYYATSTRRDAWLAAVSGVGYTYPDAYGKRFRPADRAKAYEGFLDLTGTYMRRMNETIIWPMGVSRDDLLAGYAQRIPFLKAIFPDYGRRVATYDEATYPLTSRNVPVFHAVTNWQENIPREKQIAELVSQIRGITPTSRPAFLHLFALNWFTDLPLLRQVLKDLGPEYVCVRPDQLATLYKQELARLKVLERAPQNITTLEGTPVSFPVTLRDVITKPMTAVVRLTSGLKSAHPAPFRAVLKPGETTTFTLSGTPTANRVTFAISTPAGTRTSTVRLTVIPAGEVMGPLPKDADLRWAATFTATDLAHRSGVELADRSSRSHRVWFAQPGKTEPGWIVFGPYTPEPAGRYVALFRIKGSWHGTGDVARIDACTNDGNRTLAERTLTTADTSAGTFFYYPIEFDHPGGPLETRVFWTGASPLEVDTIDLFRVVPRAPVHAP
ncbi:MAG: GxGYxYP domain-containing protein [Chthonomonadales bacterium]